MNVLPDQEQIEVQRAVSEFLLAECTPALVRRVEADGASYSRDLWRMFVELGWLTLCMPSECGGQELPLLQLGVMLEEAGRSIAPLPLIATLVPALTLARYGDPTQRELLRRVGKGEAILGFAVTEADGAWNANAIQMRARREGRHYVLDGQKFFVDHFGDADYCVVACRLDDDKVGALMVDTRSTGLTVERLVPLAKDVQTAVRFDGVRVPVDQLLGREGKHGQVVAWMMDLAAILTVPLMEGAARRAMEIAVDYVNQREAFGQPIGAFQAIQHMATDMLNAVDGTQLLMREALWRLDEGLPASVEISQAKSFANPHCLMVCRCAQQMHGRLGFITECDINLWYRRVASWTLRAGMTYEHRARIAEALLDSPGTVRLDTPVHWTDEACV